MPDKNTGPYIYRKPIGDEVLEHPFRVPEGDIVEVWERGTNPGGHSLPWVWQWRGYYPNDVPISVVWRPYIEDDSPPPELLELAEKVRKESR